MTNPFEQLSTELSEARGEIRELKELILSLQPGKKDTEEYLTRKQVKQLLKIKSNSTTFDWEKKGILKPYKIGRKTFYLKSEVENNLIQVKK